MSNERNLLTDLEAALGSLTREDYLEILQSIDQVAWIENNRILKGKPFSFQGRDYLLQPYRDESRNLIFYKGRQVEMSEFSMNWLLNKLWRHPYTAGLHTFPRDGQCVKFSKQRLDSAIRDSQSISEWYDDRNSDIRMRKFIKHDSNGLHPYNFYMLGGTWESRKDSVGDAARGTSLDFIVYDERQDHPDDVETVVGEGASHSDFKQTLTLGTPKLPGTQFDQQWESSDKNFWMVRCEHCGREERITMDNILDSGDEFFYGCPKCKNPLNRLNGRWVASNPQRRPDYRGYHINQLMVTWLTADEIIKKFNSKTYPKRRFYNEVIGEAYGGDDIPITLAMMEACADNDGKLGSCDGSIYVGIDWGATSYALLQTPTANGHKMVDVVIASDSDPRVHPKKFARALKKYVPHVKRVVCDAGPDITRFYNLRDELKAEGVRCEVWACYYATPPAKTQTSWNEKEQYVTVGRSEIIETVIDEISDVAFEIPGRDKNLERVDLFMEHCTNIAAERGKTSSGMEFIMYVNTGPDHFLHTKVYANVASSVGTATNIGSVAPSFKSSREINLMINELDRLNKPQPNKGSILFPRFMRRR